MNNMFSKTKNYGIHIHIDKTNRFVEDVYTIYKYDAQHLKVYVIDKILF